MVYEVLGNLFDVVCSSVFVSTVVWRGRPWISSLRFCSSLFSRRVAGIRMCCRAGSALLMDSTKPSNAMSPEEEENPYLRMRAEKIRRNQDRLQSLGLLKKVPKVAAKPAASSSSSKSARRNEAKKRQSSSPSVPVRRSARCAGNSTIDYKEWSGDVAQRVAAASKDPPLPPKRAKLTTTSTGITSQPAAASEVEIDEDALIAAKQAAASSTSKPSTKNTRAHVGATVSKWLGKKLDSTGKAAVIDAALEALAAGDDDGNQQYPSTVSFNKYSGICEWQNDAIFLWVNINAPNADVINEFIDDGSKMTWFGGSRMHDGTTSIQNLIRVGRNARDGSLTEADGIVLWVRIHNPSTKKFTPYICLGRVAYESHAPGTRPIEFVLKLLDSDKLKCMGKDEGEDSLFKEIIEA